MNFGLKIRDELGFEPTSNQSTLIHDLDRFLSDDDHRLLYVLKGYAGTGKTTISSALIKALEKLKRKSVLLAPTGRAAKVLAAYSQKEAMTIHRRIYFHQKVDGRMQFIRQKNLYKNCLFIVDEASMIGESGGVGGSFVSQQRSLLDDLISYVFSGDNCRLLFVGDVAQLPPVGLSISPALDPERLRMSFNLKVYQSELKQVVRQAEESGILANATVLRSFATGEESEGLQFKIDDFSDIHYINGAQLEEEVNSCYGEFGKENTLIITRSNKRANAFNQQIRVRALWMEDKLNAGDLLMVVKNNYYWLGDKENRFIANGDIVRVERVNFIEDKFGFRFADCEVILQDQEDLGEVNVKLLLNAIDSDGPSISKKESSLLYQEVLNSYALVRSKPERHKKLKADPYFNALQVKFSYAVTCHKSQGGQWDAVFVEQGFITDEMIDTEWYRWLYTAVTRARKKLYIVNFHPKFIEGDVDEYMF